MENFAAEFLNFEIKRIESDPKFQESVTVFVKNLTDKPSRVPVSRI